MINFRIVKLALNSMRERSIRSWLTVIGIVVSIATILILLTLSAGLNDAVVELFEDFGTNRIFILGPDGTSGGLGLSQKVLDENLVERIEKEPFFEQVIPSVFKQDVITYRNEDRFGLILGMPNENVDFITEQYQFDENYQGRYFREDERKVVVLGYNVATDTDLWFSKKLEVRNSITINDTKFRVVGIAKRYGTPDDDQIYIPLEDAEELFGTDGAYDYIDAILKDGVEMEVAESRLDRIMERELGEDNYAIITPEGVLRQFNQLTGVVQALLLAIASISLVVGAIGIANTMFTSVLEREKEIGILKAVGAKNIDILSLFMVESGLIGLIGGIMGVGIGIGVSYLVGFIATSMGFTLLSISINIFYVLFCLAFAFIVGAISGFLPSFTASRKKIVDTLRDI